jgi:hypothetical protein
VDLGGRGVDRGVRVDKRAGRSDISSDRGRTSPGSCPSTMEAPPSNQDGLHRIQVIQRTQEVFGRTLSTPRSHIRHRILDQAPPAPYRISPLAISGPFCRGCGSRLRWQRWVEDIFETLGIGHPAVPRLGPGTAVAGGAAAMPSFNSSTNCQFNQQWKCYQSRKFSALLQFRKWLANLTIATPEIRASPINRSA